MKKITVLYPIDRNKGNPFVDELAGIMSEDFEVVMDRKEFWKNGKNTNFNYDIIHLHWPESLFDWRTISNEDLLKLEKILIYWQKESKILLTRHNSHPHKNWLYKDEKGSALYKLISKYSHAIVHFGRFSVDEYKKRYNGMDFLLRQSHEIIPHGLYTSYINTIDMKEARENLKLPDNKQVILTFGAIRNKKESRLIKNAIMDIPIKNKIILAPRWNFSSRPLLKKGQELFYKIHPYYKLESRFVLNKEIQIYLNACDIVFIPRLENLNSGLVSLAFSFKKVVVGINKGLIGEILKETDNSTFDNNDPKNVAAAVMKGLDLSKKGMGLVNYQYGKKYWNSKIVSDKYKKVYFGLLNM